MDKLATAGLNACGMTLLTAHTSLTSRAGPPRPAGNRVARLAALLGFALACAAAEPAPGPEVQVEAEENVYTYEDPQNGAGPMWCSGSTCLVRSQDRLFVSGMEVVKGAQPLNNCRWVLYERGTNGWYRVRTSPFNLTREPCPLATTSDGRLFLSTHPTLAPGQPQGPSRSEVLVFRAADMSAPREVLVPEWQGKPQFTEHSYRSLATDAARNELILFVYSSSPWAASWSLLDDAGLWSARGELRWPWGATYERPQPIRIAYPNVLLRNRAVHLCGVSDIVEPKSEWRAFKKQLTGRDWDYDFRRLFYTFSRDIRAGHFADWVEVASREDTCGWIMPGDLWLDDENVVHLVWSERAIDERLRERFFPKARQSHAINYARLRNGEIILRQTLALAQEGVSEEIPSAPRFQITPAGRLYVIYYVSGRNLQGQAVSENRLLEVLPDGTPSAAVRVPLQHPLNSYFTATPRAGSPLSNTLDMLGTRADTRLTISYARVLIR